MDDFRKLFFFSMDVLKFLVELVGLCTNIDVLIADLNMISTLNLQQL